MECYSPGAVVVQNDTAPKPTHEVVMVVKFNQGEGLILKEPINLTYYKFGNDTIIATDGVFYNFYAYEVDRYAQAFAGRKFTLTMNDGEVVECSGQWWSARTHTARMLIDQPMTSGTANDLVSLQGCYVFIGHEADAVKWQELRNTYTGPVYEYRDGEFIIKSWLKRPGKLKGFLTDYNGKRCVVDEHKDIYDMQTINGKLYLKYSLAIGWHGLYKEYPAKKDFSVKEPRVIKDYGLCHLCKKDTARVSYGDGTYICHLCEKELNEQDNRENYNYGY
jgi:hypothetical protein